jgi:hypothetical protein
MGLLNKENIKLFKNLEEINDGFRIPDEAYVHGKDFECFEQLGGDAFFSNFWYGEKTAAVAFAETVAAYFKEKYDNTPFEEDCYDFYGMVVLWHVGDKALVASINLNDQFAFYGYEKGLPDALLPAFEQSQLQHLLTDGDDNTATSFLYIDCSEDVVQDLFSCVADSAKEDYINEAKDEGIELNIP